MNLQQTIADLENQAARYTEAANVLRALLQDGTHSLDEVTEQTTSLQQSGTAARGASRAKAGRKGSKKREVSAETRARMAAAAKARYERRRENQQGQGGQENQAETT